MSRYTRWLRDTIFLQFQGGKLLREGEELIHACRATSSAANAAENAGDEFLTRGHGRGIVMSQLLMLPGMSRFDGKDQADFCGKLARYFCANVGFGPYATEALRLREMYAFTPGLALNTEILAGVFEQTLHVLQRAGLDVLIKHLLMWCVGCVLYLLNDTPSQAGYDRHQDNFLRDLDGGAYASVVNLGAHELLWPLTDPVRHPMLKRAFAIDKAGDDRHNADALFSGWVDGAMRESNTGGAGLSIVPVPAAGADAARHGGQMKGGDLRSYNLPDGLTKYYMDLLCYEWNCSNRAQTAEHDSAEDARAEAVSMGWWRPRSKGWRNVRCPACFDK